jgi:hypothetical protein
METGGVPEQPIWLADIEAQPASDRASVNNVLLSTI